MLLCRRLTALALAFALAPAGLVACSPVFDWREVRPEGSSVVAMFPCRPSRHERDLSLDGQPLHLALLSCSAGDALFAIAFGNVGDAAQIAPTLESLRVAPARNIGSSETAASAFEVPGVTPNPQSLQMRLQGRRPDGSVVEGQVAVFSIGPQVVQAQVLASRLDAEAVRVFLAGLQVSR